MASEPNRAALAQSFRLRDNASDAEIIAAIRKVARTFRGMGRPFVLPRNLDLAGCLEAVHVRKLDEVQHARRDAMELMKINARQRRLGLRCMALDFILDVNGTRISPSEEP